MYNCRDAYWNCFASVCFWNRVWNFHWVLVSRCAQRCPQLSWLVLLLIVRCDTHLGQTIWFVCHQPQLHSHFCLQYFTVTYCPCSLSHPFELVLAPPRFSFREEANQKYQTNMEHSDVLTAEILWDLSNSYQQLHLHCSDGCLTQQKPIKNEFYFTCSKFSVFFLWLKKFYHHFKPCPLKHTHAHTHTEKKHQLFWKP